jgi:hypothetical protein
MAQEPSRKRKADAKASLSSDGGGGDNDDEEGAQKRARQEPRPWFGEHGQLYTAQNTSVENITKDVAAGVDNGHSFSKMLEYLGDYFRGICQWWDPNDNKTPLRGDSSGYTLSKFASFVHAATEYRVDRARCLRALQIKTDKKRERISSMSKRELQFELALQHESVDGELKVLQSRLERTMDVRVPGLDAAYLGWCKVQKLADALHDKGMSDAGDDAVPELAARIGDDDSGFRGLVGSLLVAIQSLDLFHVSPRSDTWFTSTAGADYHLPVRFLTFLVEHVQLVARAQGAKTLADAATATSLAMALDSLYNDLNVSLRDTSGKARKSNTPFKEAQWQALQDAIEGAMNRATRLKLMTSATRHSAMVTDDDDNDDDAATTSATAGGGGGGSNSSSGSTSLGKRRV